MLVFLLGYMGSGKSTIGAGLSKIMNLDFIDLDILINKNTKMSIHQIFSQKGEDFFRKKEHEILTNYRFKSNSIVAVGGGTPCFYGNHDFMKSIGKTIYLKVSSNELVSRLKLDKKRPLLFNNKLNLKDFIDLEINHREEYYRMSNYILESDNILINQVEKIVNKII